MYQGFLSLDLLLNFGELVLAAFGLWISIAGTILVLKYLHPKFG